MSLTSVRRRDKEASNMINTFGSIVQVNVKWYHRQWRHSALLSRSKYVVSEIKREKIEKSTTYDLQQCNLLNDQELYQPRTSPLTGNSTRLQTSRLKWTDIFGVLKKQGFYFCSLTKLKLHFVACFHPLLFSLSWNYPLNWINFLGLGMNSIKRKISAQQKQLEMYAVKHF